METFTQQLTSFKTFITKVIPISEEKLRLLASKARPVEFQAGDLFIREGAVCKNILFIHRGLFRYFIEHDGKDFTKDFSVDALNPFCTSYTSFMKQRPSEIYIEAVEPSLVWIWDHSVFVPLLEEDPVWIRFERNMAQYLFYRKEQKEIESIKCSATEKYTHFLRDFPDLSQRIPQYHIASYLGITPESLSRIRRKIARVS